jgi:hypothetical protein
VLLSISPLLGLVFYALTGASWLDLVAGLSSPSSPSRKAEKPGTENWSRMTTDKTRTGTDGHDHKHADPTSATPAAD